MHNYSRPPKSILVEPPLAAITDASLLGYSSIGLAHLATGIFLAILQGKSVLLLLLVGWVPLVYSNL